MDEREERILPVGPLVVPKHRIQIFPMEFERIAGDRFTDSFVDAGSSRAAACSPFARRALSAFACRAIRNSRYAFIKKISLAGCSLSLLKIFLSLSLSARSWTRKNSGGER